MLYKCLHLVIPFIYDEVEWNKIIMGIDYVFKEQYNLEMI